MSVFSFSSLKAMINYLSTKINKSSQLISSFSKLSKEEREAIMSRLTGGSLKRTSQDDSSIINKTPQIFKSGKKNMPPSLVRRSSGGKNDGDEFEGKELDNTEEVQSNVLQKRDGVAPVYRDYADWKRKNDVPSDAKVFSMTGWYPCVKQALFERGWHFNPDPQSPYFDLKWSLRSCEVSLEQLKPGQLTNHFHKNGAITTKVGLLRSLSSLVWFADVCSNDIIPRGFDLTNPQETLMFMDDFACQQAENILKSIYFKCTGKGFPEEESLVSCDDGPAGNVYDRPKTPGLHCSEEGAIKANLAVFDTCCVILERLIRLKETSDEYLDDKKSGVDEMPVHISYKNDISSPSIPCDMFC